MAKEQLNFMGCLKLLEKCVEEDILQIDPDRKDNILVYREAGADKAKFPEGWYSVNAHNLAQELMNEPDGQKVLVDALEEKGVAFEPMSMWIRYKEKER